MVVKDDEQTYQNYLSVSVIFEEFYESQYFSKTPNIQN